MRKKAMIFILEGPSDDTSLAGSLNKVYFFIQPDRTPGYAWRYRIE